MDWGNKQTGVYLDVDLISAENNWNVLTNAFKVTMPVGNVLVGDTRSDVKHDNTTLALNVVTITETTELLLTGSIPHVETYGAEVCAEGQRVNLDTKGGFE